MKRPDCTFNSMLFLAGALFLLKAYGQYTCDHDNSTDITKCYQKTDYQVLNG